MKFETLVDNIHMEGIMSQILDIGPSLNIMSKTGNFWLFFHSLFVYMAPSI